MLLHCGQRCRTPGCLSNLPSSECPPHSNTHSYTDACSHQLAPHANSTKHSSAPHFRAAAYSRRGSPAQPTPNSRRYVNSSSSTAELSSVLQRRLQYNPTSCTHGTFKLVVNIMQLVQQNCVYSNNDNIILVVF